MFVFNSLFVLKLSNSVVKIKKFGVFFKELNFLFKIMNFGIGFIELLFFYCKYFLGIVKANDRNF